jgi:hypothetical protein
LANAEAYLANAGAIEQVFGGVFTVSNLRSKLSLHLSPCALMNRLQWMRPLTIRRVFHCLPPARSSSSLADEPLFLPTSARWLWGERHEKQQDAKTSNVSALKEVIVKIRESESFSRTFPALLKGHNEVFGPHVPDLDGGSP